MTEDICKRAIIHIVSVSNFTLIKYQHPGYCISRILYTKTLIPISQYIKLHRLKDPRFKIWRREGKRWNLWVCWSNRNRQHQLQWLQEPLLHPQESEYLLSLRNPWYENDDPGEKEQRDICHRHCVCFLFIKNRLIWWWKRHDSEENNREIW